MPGIDPSTVSESLWHTPQAWTSNGSSPGPGAGTWRSTRASFPPACGTAIAIMFGIVDSPGRRISNDSLEARLGRCRFECQRHRDQLGVGSRGTDNRQPDRCSVNRRTWKVDLWYARQAALRAETCD